VNDDAAGGDGRDARAATLPTPEVVSFIGFALLAGALVFDWCAAKDIAAQLRATRYAVTEGRITSSRVLTDATGEPPPTHSVGVTYTYEVQGRALAGSHYYADDGWGASSGDWADEIVRTIPPGARVPVYFAPEDPSRAVLRPGVTGGQLLSLMLAVTLTLIPTSLVVGARRRRRGVADPMESAAAKRELEIPSAVAPFRALFAAVSPSGAAVLVLGLASTLMLFSFVAVFGSHPSLGLAAAAWAVVGAATAAAYAARSFSSSASGARTRNTTPSSV
jgi:hypothetical protein